MSSRIDALFDRLKTSGKKALIPFITAGYPEIQSTVPLLHALVENGADMIEIGVPFSDPVADGPVIQESSFVALQRGISVGEIFTLVAEFRKNNQHTPLVLMGYANPIEAFGWQAYAQEAKKSGIDGLITVDCPPEPNDLWGSICQKNELDRIILLAPTTSRERRDLLVQNASGFIYYVALKGVTGNDSLASQQESVVESVSDLKAQTAMPVVVGFGIKNTSTAKFIATCADGVVVGSTIVSLLTLYQEDAKMGVTKVAEFIADLRKAL